MKRDMLAACAVIFIVCGCSDDAPQANGRNALPENPAWAVSEPERTNAIVSGALDYCAEMSSPIARMAGCTAVPLGQLRLVKQRLTDPSRYLDREPLCIYATTGTAGTGDQYFSVSAFSLSREIEQVEVLARGPDMESTPLSIGLPRETKSLEAIWSQYFVVEREDWNTFRSRGISDDVDSCRVDWADGTVIPLPRGPGIELCVRVVDRVTGSSAWIPVCHFDYPDAPERD